MDSSCTVQHVTKASSDQLLRKFAEQDSEPVIQLPRGPTRRKRSTSRVISSAAARNIITSRRKSGSVAEWNSLLPTSSRPLRKMGIGPGEATGIGILLAAFEKAWRKTVEGVSNMFVVEHCNGHARLTSDVV